MFVRKGFHEKEILVVMFVVAMAMTARAGNGCIENGPTTNYVCVSNAYLYMSTISVFNVAGTIYASATTSSKSGVANECLKYKCQRTKIVPVPVTVSTISGYSVTGPHVSSGGGLQVSFPAPASGSGTITMWVTGTVDRCSVQPGHISRTANYPPPPTVPTIKTETVAVVPSDRSRKKLGVGEMVSLTLEPSLLNPVTWSLSGDGALSATSGNPVTFTACDHATTSSITATYSGGSCSVGFTVVEPTGETAVKSGSDDTFPSGVQGAGMRLEITIYPTDVSFDQVESQEVAGPATSITGYFINYSPVSLSHAPVGWVGILPGNKKYDHAAFSGWSAPWCVGSFQWVIPIQWRVVGSTNIGTLPNRIQTFSINGTSGNSTVAKLGQSVSRTP